MYRLNEFVVFGKLFQKVIYAVVVDKRVAVEVSGRGVQSNEFLPLRKQ